MKKLFLTDLDGTLLRTDERISDYSSNIINQFIENGGLFSYATARSFVTASKVTGGLNITLPVICHNGVFIIEGTTKKLLLSNYFTSDDVSNISEILNAYSIYPIVFAEVNGKERFSYIDKFVTPAMKHFLNSRIGDPRIREVSSSKELYIGNVFNCACMDTEETLNPIYEILYTNRNYNCIYQKDIYSGTQWCEIYPVNASKANATIQLKTLLECDKIIVFGDGRNDISLFSIADEKYAVANAVPELKEVATAVIESNDNDGVAKWIATHAS